MKPACAKAGEIYGTAARWPAARRRGWFTAASRSARGSFVLESESVGQGWPGIRLEPAGPVVYELLKDKDWQAQYISFRDTSPVHKFKEPLFLPPARRYREEFAAAPVRRATALCDRAGHL